MLRRLDAAQAEVDPLELVAGDDRSHPDRPWVMMNMISSVDGATAVDGRSSSLGDDDDLAMFKAIRSVPDVILVGAGTVAAEDYHPVTLDAPRRSLRSARGQAETPILAIVSGRLSVDPESRVFSDSEHRPLILTSTSANPGRLVNLGDSAEIAFLPDLTPAAILGQISAASVVLLEGGPSLNGQFVAAGLVDEINLTVAPYLVSGDSRRLATGAAALPPLAMTLDRAVKGDAALFLRYLRAQKAKDHSDG